jgi:hypothetical protein
MPDTFEDDSFALIDALTLMQTADEPSIESTRKLLPEMPYMNVMRPAAFDGPTLSTDTDTASIADGEYLYESGAGRVQSGWLTLADSSLRGYGTMGQSATPLSYIYPLQTETCNALYLGVIAYPLVDQASGWL